MGLRYLVRRDGHMAACTATVHALAKTDPSLDRPDVKIQMHNLSAEDPRHATSSCSTSFRASASARSRCGRNRGARCTSARPIPTSRRRSRPTIWPTRATARPASPRCGWRAASPSSQHCKALIVREVRPGPEAQSDEALLEHIARAGRHLLSPDRHVQDGHRRDGGGGSMSSGAWHQGPARRRRLDHADHGVLQHQRALVPDRRALRRIPAARRRRQRDPEALRAETAEA